MTHRDVQEQLLKLRVDEGRCSWRDHRQWQAKVQEARCTTFFLPTPRHLRNRQNSNLRVIDTAEQELAKLLDGGDRPVAAGGRIHPSRMGGS